MKLKNSNFHLGTCCREKVSGASEWKQFLCVRVRGGFHFSWSYRKEGPERDGMTFGFFSPCLLVWAQSFVW